MKTLSFLVKTGVLGVAGLVSLLACSSSDTSSSSTSSSSGSTGSSGASGGTTSSGASGTSGGGGGQCGSQTCTDTQYCQLNGARAAGGGDIVWTASACKAFPTGCTNGPAACSCILKSNDCPQQGAVSSKCAASLDNTLQFGCGTF